MDEVMQDWKMIFLLSFSQLGPLKTHGCFIASFVVWNMCTFGDWVDIIGSV